MNTIVAATIMAALIAVIANVVRSSDNRQESNMAYIIKMFAISFVVIYFGMGYITKANCPEIEMGEPDF